MATRRSNRKRLTNHLEDNVEELQKETYSKRLAKKLKSSKSLHVEKSHENTEKELSANESLNISKRPMDNKGDKRDDNKNNFGLKPRKTSINLNAVTPLSERSSNLLHYLQLQTIGQKCRPRLVKSVYNSIINVVSELQLCRTACPFDRRVTAMEWHPTNPDVLAVGSKGGDIILWDTKNVNNDKFIQGIGAGGIINALKFWPEDHKKVLSAAVDGRVTLHDFEGKRTQVLADTTNPHDYWYCSVDVNEQRRMIVAGDNVGNTQLMSYDGKKIFDFRLHKNKVTHTEFSPREDWLLCTSSTDQTVQFWDVRMMKDRKSFLYLLKHDKPINSAYFSHTDGCRLLTTDQYNQVRVYKAPEWTLEQTVLHPHRFFQHITPIKASWHPLQDLVVVGRYPDPKFEGYTEGELRSIDIIDIDNGDIVCRLSDPTASGLVCLNKFNMRGDTLASGMGLHILLWSRQDEIVQQQEKLLKSMKQIDGTTGSSSRQQRPRSNQTKKTDNKSKTDTKSKLDNAKLKMKMSKR